MWRIRVALILMRHGINPFAKVKHIRFKIVDRLSILEKEYLISCSNDKIRWRYILYHEGC